MANFFSNLRDKYKQVLGVQNTGLSSVTLPKKNTPHKFTTGEIVSGNFRAIKDNVTQAGKNLVTPRVYKENLQGLSGNVASTRRNYESNQVNKYVKPALDFTLNTGQVYLSGLSDVANSFSRENKVGGAAQAAYGLSKMAVPFLPGTAQLFQGANAVASQPFKVGGNDQGRRLSRGIMQGIGLNDDLGMNVKRQNTVKLPFEMGEFDPFMSGGYMLGYVKNPLNKQLFKGTEKLLPSAGKAWMSWIGTTAARGALEEVILGLAEMPDGLTTQQQVKRIIDRIPSGVAAELFGQAAFTGLGKVGGELSSVSRNALDSKAAQQTVEGLQKWARHMMTPVKTMEYDEAGQRVTIPMWKYIMSSQRGAVDPNAKVGKPSIEEMAAQRATEAGVEGRPAHQAALEKLWNAGKFEEADKLIKSIPDTDPYKAKMAELGEMMKSNKPRFPKANKFEGFDDLTTKVLNRLKGSKMTSRQHIENLLRQKDVKQVERDVIKSVLDEMPENQFPVQKFADNLKDKLVILNPKIVGDSREGLTSHLTPEYDSVRLAPDKRGDVSQYIEKIYRSPVKNYAADTHFANRDIDDYFAHARIENMSDGITRRIIEIQSDLFQKGRLDSTVDERIIMTRDLIKKLEQDGYFADEATSEWVKGSDGRTRRVTTPPKNPKPVGPRLKKLRAELAKLTEAEEAKKKPIVPYRNAYQERVIREELKAAAKDGKKKLQIPTGETAMHIEGLVNRNDPWVTMDNELVSPDGANISRGDAITFRDYDGRMNDWRKWIVTRNNEDGTFRAVDTMAMENDSAVYSEMVERGYIDMDSGAINLPRNLPSGFLNMIDDIAEELSAKDVIDTKNPIYKFYESNIGKYVKRFGAKRVTDSQGVEWWEIPVRQEYANQPVEAFAVIPTIGQDEEGKYRITGAVPIVPGLLKGADLEIKTSKVFNFIDSSKTPEEAIKKINGLSAEWFDKGNKEGFQVLKKALQKYKKVLVTGPGMPRDPMNQPIIEAIDDVLQHTINDLPKPGQINVSDLPTPTKLADPEAGPQMMKEMLVEPATLVNRGYPTKVVDTLPKEQVKYLIENNIPYKKFKASTATQPVATPRNTQREIAKILPKPLVDAMVPKADASSHPKYTTQDLDEMRIKAIDYEEGNRPEFDEVFAKFVGKRDAARTRATKVVTDNGLHKLRGDKELMHDVIHYMEGYKTDVSPEAKKWAKEYKQVYDNLHKEVNQRGIPTRYWRNYVPHFWNESPEQVEKMFMSAKGKFKHSKSRSIPYYGEMLELGATPKYDHPAQILEAYVVGMERAIANKEFVDEMLDKGVIVPAEAGVEIPGFKQVIAQGIPDEYKAVGEGKYEPRSYYAPSRIADQINRVFDEAPSTGNIGKFLSVGAKINSKWQDLVLSGGLPYTPLNAFGLAQVLYKEMPSGRVRGPMKAVWKSMSPDASMKYFAENADDIMEMQKRNTPIYTNFTVKDMLDKPTLRKIFGGEGNVKAEKFADGWTKAVNEPTFKRLLPMLQVEMYKDVKAGQIEAGKSSEEAADIANKAVQNFYGVITSDARAKRNQLTNDALGTFLFAPHFRETMLNFWGNVGKSSSPVHFDVKKSKQPIQNVRLNNPFSPENVQQTRFLIGASALYAAYNAVNYAYNGVPMWENPEYKKDKVLIPVGDQYIGLPFLPSIATMPRLGLRAAGLVAKAEPGKAAAEIVKGGASMPLKLGGEIITNRNYFGAPIYDKDGTKGQKLAQQGEHVMKSTLLAHPWAREIYDLNPWTGESKPAYQRLSQAVEAPLRYYDKKSTDSRWNKAEVDIQKANKGGGGFLSSPVQAKGKGDRMVEEKNYDNEYIKDYVEATGLVPENASRDALLDYSISKMDKDEKPIDRQSTYKWAAKVVESNEYTSDQKKMLLDHYKLPPEKVKMYSIAGQTEQERADFIQTTLMRDDVDRIQLFRLTRQRINGRELLSNGVIDELRYRGLMSKDEADIFKKARWNEIEQRWVVKGMNDGSSSKSKKAPKLKIPASSYSSKSTSNYNFRNKRRDTTLSGR